MFLQFTRKLVKLLPLVLYRRTNRILVGMDIEQTDNVKIIKYSLVSSLTLHQEMLKHKMRERQFPGTTTRKKGWLDWAWQGEEQATATTVHQPPPAKEHTNISLLRRNTLFKVPLWIGIFIGVWIKGDYGEGLRGPRPFTTMLFTIPFYVRRPSFIGRMSF